MNYRKEAQQIQSSCSRWSRKSRGVQNKPLNWPGLVTIFPPAHTLITDSDDQNRELLFAVWNTWCLKEPFLIKGNLCLSLNSCNKMYVQIYTKILVILRNGMRKGRGSKKFFPCLSHTCTLWYTDPTCEFGLLVMIWIIITNISFSWASLSRGFGE